MIYSIPDNEILEPLRGFINKIYCFSKLGESGTSIHNYIEPNGMAKLILTLESDISCIFNDSIFFVPKGKLALAGVFDSTFKVEATKIDPFQAIVIEFIPIGSYRFSNINQKKISNKFCSLYEIFGQPANELEKQIQHETVLESKLFILQQFLVHCINNTNPDYVFDFCIQHIYHNLEVSTIKELEELTGYSSRWLNHKFEYRLGISAKTFKSIVRFQTNLHTLASNLRNTIKYNSFYDYYYDQSHYIKEFKRFAGTTPHKFINDALKS